MLSFTSIYDKKNKYNKNIEKLTDTTYEIDV